MRGDSVAFVEVKSWERMPITELDRVVDARKRRRLRLSSLAYVQRHPVLETFRRRYELLFLADGGRKVRHMTVAVGE